MNYYPYLRGKQYELISLRGLNEFITNRNIVCPIIEPVKISSTLSRTISTLQDNGNSFILLLSCFIINPLLFLYNGSVISSGTLIIASSFVSPDKTCPPVIDQTPAYVALFDFRFCNKILFPGK